jgi:hypothetical protein
MPFAAAPENNPNRWVTQASLEFVEATEYQPPYGNGDVGVGYDRGFRISSSEELDLDDRDFPFQLQINGWGQLRHTVVDSKGENPDLNQFQLKRARIVFAGSAFDPAVQYFVQLDGRSSSGDDLRLLDYYLRYDFGSHLWCFEDGTFGFQTGKYKMPFTLARELSGREFEFADRSMASMYFDVNRSLAWGLYGKTSGWQVPLHWDLAVFNGLVTGGAETGSSGVLDNNFAYSLRLYAYPNGEWGPGQLADLSYHETLATRVGAGFAHSTIERSGETEFERIRVVDSGDRLAEILPEEVQAYSVALYCVDASMKYRGLSLTSEYYLRNIGGFGNVPLPDFFDHGFWLQMGYFVIPEKLQFLLRWSRVAGNSGTLGDQNQSAEELAGGLVWYLNGQHAKIVLDATHLDGAPISSSALDIFPGDLGWLYRTQIQFAF